MGDLERFSSNLIMTWISEVREKVCKEWKSEGICFRYRELSWDSIERTDMVNITVGKIIFMQ